MGTTERAGSAPGAQSPGDSSGICRADYGAYDPQEPPGRRPCSLLNCELQELCPEKTDKLNVEYFCYFHSVRGKAWVNLLKMTSETGGGAGSIVPH